MVKHILVLITILVLYGCAPVVKDYYLPVDVNSRTEGYTCGWTPYGGYSKEVQPGVRFGLNVIPTDSGLDIGITVILSDSPALLFLTHNPVLVIIPMPRAKHISIPVSFTKPKRIIDKYLHSFASINVDGKFSQHITISLSGLAVDGTSINLGGIDFNRVSKKGVMACVQ